MFRSLIASLAFILTVAAQAAEKTDLLKDFDALSGNDVLLQRAKALNPEIKTQIVQERAVKRAKRFEFSPIVSNTFGGDAYVKTQTVGVDAQYHINYRFSVGARYNYAFNELTAEGKNLIRSNILASVPAIDYIKSEAVATVSWYPAYGKFNLFDKGVVHFDFYTMAGYGQMTLESGSSPAMTAGAGFAFWISQHLTSRLEMRWLGYEAERAPGKAEDMNLTVASLSVGYLL